MSEKLLDVPVRYIVIPLFSRLLAIFSPFEILADRYNPERWMLGSLANMNY